MSSSDFRPLDDDGSKADDPEVSVVGAPSGLFPTSSSASSAAPHVVPLLSTSPPPHVTTTSPSPSPSSSPKNVASSPLGKPHDSRWNDYPFQRMNPNAPPPWTLPKPDSYLLNALDPEILMQVYQIIRPGTDEPESVLLTRFHLFEKIAIFKGNYFTTSIIFAVLAPILFALPFILDLSNNILIGFILFPPFYVLVRVIIQRFIGDGSVLRTLKVLNAQLATGSGELVECEELQENLGFATQILLTLFTNVSVFVTTVVDRKLLIAGIFISVIASFFLFIKFFYSRVDPASRVSLRLHRHFALLASKYDTAKLQHRMKVSEVRLYIFPRSTGCFSIFCGLPRAYKSPFIKQDFITTMDGELRHHYPHSQWDEKNAEVILLEPQNAYEIDSEMQKR